MTLPPEQPPPNVAERARQRGQDARRRAHMWLSPGMGVKRWLSLFVLCTLIGAVGFLHFTWTGPWHFVATRWILWLNRFAQPGSGLPL